jgi:hypothetical protein
MSLGNSPRIQHALSFLLYLLQHVEQKNDAFGIIVLVWQNGLVLLHFFIAG